jgi:hypothetical protein
LEPEAEPSIQRIGDDSLGALQFEVSSDFQQTKTVLRILVPGGSDQPSPCKHVYTLPVQPGSTGKWGDPLQVIKSNNLHNHLNIAAICPSFSDWPWYADHPLKKDLRQESFLVHLIVPFIDRLFPSDHPQRILLGFSKSGLGAFSLMLRHPELFACAGAWDAPLMLVKPDEFEMPQVYGTQENYEKHQFSRLLVNNRDCFRNAARFVLGGYDVFKDHMEAAHQLMLDLDIPHLYQNEAQKAHCWDSGWLERMLASLVNLEAQPRAAIYKGK